LDDRQGSNEMQIMENKRFMFMKSPHWYACDRYGLISTLGGVGGDLSQTDQNPLNPMCIINKIHPLQQNPRL